MGKRGTRGPYGRYSTGDSFGEFLKSLRMARRMTQKEYAAFIGIGLRTLVSQEKSQVKNSPWEGSAVGYGLGRHEFSSRSGMLSAYAKFREERKP